MKCRYCSNELNNVFVDLGTSPVSNSFLSKDDLNKSEIYFPLKLWICDNCFLVQVDEFKSARDIFNNEYAYFSSYSTTWLSHAEKYVNMITGRLLLNDKSKVIEIASNDGYLLQYFKEKNIPCLGIEPTANTAGVAAKKGIRTSINYFTSDLANELITSEGKADLIIGNNVFAHVPDINDFVKGLKILLKSDGTITLEFPHLLNLIEEKQFDTIYHEHFWYFSLFALDNVFKRHQLVIYDVEELETHGGSLRLYIGHLEDKKNIQSNNVKQVLKKETDIGINDLNYYKTFAEEIQKIKIDFVSLIIELKKAGKKVAAYGAAAKGNTFLNYCGIRNDFIDFIVDASPYKQDKYLPGSHIPIVSIKELELHKPDYILILPWNIKEEIMKEIDFIRFWKGKFIISIPRLTVIN